VTFRRRRRRRGPYGGAAESDVGDGGGGGVQSKQQQVDSCREALDVAIVHEYSSTSHHLPGVGSEHWTMQWCDSVHGARHGCVAEACVQSTLCVPRQHLSWEMPGTEGTRAEPPCVAPHQ
jgi:hypothetical protein